MKPRTQSAKEQILTLRLADGSANFAQQLGAWTPEKLPPELANYLWALAIYYQRTNNTWFVVEAYTKLIESRLTPPAWVLDALAAGLGKHLKNPGADLCQQIGLAKRGSGTTRPHDEFIKLKRLSRAMPDFWRLLEQMNIPATVAAKAVVWKHDLGFATSTLTKYYRNDWAPFYRALGYSPSAMTHAQQVKFLITFPEEARTTIRNALKSMSD